MIAGVWLLAVGACDLLRAARDSTSPRRRVLLVLVGVVALLTVATATGFDVGWWVTVGLTWVVGLVAWVVCSSFALDPSTARRPLWRAAAFASFGVPLALLVLGGSRRLPTLQPVDDLFAHTLVGQLGAARVVVFLGVSVALVSTGNVLVRLLLDAVGVPAAVNEKKLRGGRVLGPMERIFLLALAAFGQVGAGSIVVAAKALLRYPELRRADAAANDAAATDTSEYFLIGSFASWLLAVGGWALVVLLVG